MSLQAQRIVARAKSQKGFREGANNDNKYGKAFGGNHAPWCAYFVSWVFKEEGLLHLIGQTPKGFCNCADFQEWAIEQKQTVPVGKIQGGDILLFGEKGGKPYHTGIAEDVINLKTGKVFDWEGNTSSGAKGSQANGDGVYHRSRHKSWILTVFRPAWEE